MYLWCLLISHEWTGGLSELCKGVRVLTIHIHVHVHWESLILLLLLLLHEWIKLFEILLIYRWTLVVYILPIILISFRLLLLVRVSLRLGTNSSTSRMTSRMVTSGLVLVNWWDNHTISIQLLFVV